MAELISCCFSLSLLLAKKRFVLSDLAGRLRSSSQVLGHCISCSRGTESTVNISLLHIPGRSFPISGAIQDGKAKGKVSMCVWRGGVEGGRLLAARRHECVGDC